MRRAGGLASRLGGMAARTGRAARRIGSQARQMGGAAQHVSSAARRIGGAARQMGAGARRVRGWRFLAPCAASALAVPALGILLLTPTAHNAVRLATRLATAATTLSRHAPRAPATAPSGTLFEETPAVGALFVVSSGGLGRHFCTASVVHSPHEDLVITAAHCVSSKAPGQIAFVPGYHDGDDPYGVWLVTRVVVDARWRDSRDPNHDVAFLVIQRHGGTTGVERLTGGERLGTGWPAWSLVHVIGYPDRAQWAVICTSRTRPFGRHQMRFDCAGYTGGTSGGPFLASSLSATGLGTVIGVIGGYEQGGDLASVSYSPRFGRAMRDLYLTAVADG
jgi:V8-like Glu-specific endopeptidase